MKPSVLCVIPARIGSRRVPEKNRRLLGGMNLVQLAHRYAQESGVCDRIIVSGDAHYGSGMEHLWGPQHLYDGESDIGAVTDHALSVAEREGPMAFDFVVTLQPATPLRSGALIGQMLEDMVHTRSDSAITCAHVVPWTWRVERGRASNDWTPAPYPRSKDVRFHNLQEINTVQIASAATVRDGKRWATPLLIAEIPSWATMDIDTPEDLVEAQRHWPWMSKALEEWTGYRFHLVHDINASVPG